MKKLFLTGVAVLFLATGTAHADVSLSPTDPLIGSWCDGKLLTRGTCDTFIEQSGYAGVETACMFLEIKRIRNGIEAFSKCTAESLDRLLYYENVRLQIIDKRLKFELLKEYNYKIIQIDTGDTHRSMCVRVQPTPDGYLNVRQLPGMNFKIVGKLIPGQSVSIDVQTGEWTHVRGGCDKGASEGWVYSKYVIDKNESGPEEDDTPISQTSPYKIIPGATVIPGLPLK
jgi:hypothetical protein